MALLVAKLKQNDDKISLLNTDVQNSIAKTSSTVLTKIVLRRRPYFERLRAILQKI